MKLSYYFFNEHATNFNDLILPNKVNEDNNYFELQPRNEQLDFECKVYIQKNRTKEPKWINFLETDIEIPNKDEIKNTVNSFVILIKVLKDENPYFFAITGGFGFTAISRNNLESNFGLKVALNTINSNELKAFDVRNIDLKTKQKRVHINRGSELGEFDLNFEQDLINLVSGKSKDGDVGTSVRGSTSSLSLNSTVTFSQLGEKCSQLLDLFLSDDYKENFSFIDNIKIVKDPETLTELQNKLFDCLRNRETHHISLAYPDMIEYEKCTNYKIKLARKNIETEEVALHNIYSLLDKDGVIFNSVDQIKNIKIIGFDASGEPVTSPVSLNHFIIFQTELEGDTYIYSLNNWYKIDSDYFEQIHNSIMAIPIIEDENFLTAIRYKEREEHYNDRQNVDYFLCLDQANFQIPNSKSKIEVCDLLSRDKHFVCVKKDTRSATLSHLFAQGSVSMQLLRESSEYRNSLVAKAEQKFPEESYSEQDFPYNECTLVYAISTTRPQDIRDILPFFSKVNLLHHVNLIKRLGIKVALYKIPVLDEDNHTDAS
ncbi:TIGR04141 family sporadically distributed protein [Bacillus cereus]|nr:TIGR04141 family sporadically distributed protein [Bacillus cereus]MCU5143228.1 TIGR04141 family sporadically distributed protein [Bacillus cereus]